MKGHATDSHVAEGIATQTHKTGNFIADQVADIATQLHGKDIISIASWYQYRINMHSKFMCSVSKHLVEGYLIHRALLDGLEAKQQDAMHDRGACYNPLAYADPLNARCFKSHLSLANFTQFRSANPYALHVQGFLANLRVARAGEGGA